MLSLALFYIPEGENIVDRDLELQGDSQNWIKRYNSVSHRCLPPFYKIIWFS